MEESYLDWLRTSVCDLAKKNINLNNEVKILKYTLETRESKNQFLLLEKNAEITRLRDIIAAQKSELACWMKSELACFELE